MDLMASQFTDNGTICWNAFQTVNKEHTEGQKHRLVWGESTGGL